MEDLPLGRIAALVPEFAVKDQVAQAARLLATGWKARVRFLVSQGWRFFLRSFVSRLVLGYTQPHINEHAELSPGVKAVSVELTTLPLPTDLAAYMSILVSTSTAGFHGL